MKRQDGKEKQSKSQNIEAKDKLEESQMDNDLKGFDKANISLNPSDDVFNIEKARISMAYDTFVPAPGISIDDVQRERSRLQAIEDSIRNKSAYPKRSQGKYGYDNLSKDLILRNEFAIRIQRTYRGHLGRRKYLLSKQLQYLVKYFDTANDWIEVRDRSTGDVWYYNKKSGESQWERPLEMKSTLSNSGKLKLLPIDQSQQKTKSSDDSNAIQKQTNNQSTILNSPTGNKKTLKPIKKPPNTIDMKLQHQHENDLKAHKEIEKLMGIDKIMSSDKLITPDGHFKPNLRTAILDALVESRFEGTSNGGKAIDEEDVQKDTPSSKDAKSFDLKHIDDHSFEHKPVNVLNKPMVSILKIHDKKILKKNNEQLRIVDTGDSNGYRMRSPDGYDRTSGVRGVDGAVESNSDTNSEDRQGFGYNNTNLCFACWSSGNRTCFLHSKITSSSKLRPSESMLLCRNWDLNVLTRRYRSEDMQEIFLKRNSSLRYDNKRKKFTTVEEYKHVIYRLLKNALRQGNYSGYIINKTKKWLMSIVEVISSNKGLIQSSDSTTAYSNKVSTLVDLILDNKDTTGISKRTENNIKRLETLCHRMRQHLSNPPTTGYTLAERNHMVKYLYQEYDPTLGKLVELINILPFPSTEKLYTPREYPLPIPRAIPMPIPSYHDTKEYLSLSKLKTDETSQNVYIDRQSSNSWLERVVSAISRDCTSTAMAQIESITPKTSTIRSISESNMSTIKFALLGYKATPDMLSVGGLPMEFLVYQLITTYFPPQYGNFILMDKSLANPGVSPEVMIKFDSILVPPVKQDYVSRPVEHALNYRKAPTIGIHTTVPQSQTIIVSQKDQTFYYDNTYDDKHFYGLNRPEQTGEQQSHGFRTSTWIKHLEIYEETDPLVFCPGSDIVSYNIPAANKSYTTHADLTYPFCEPSTRDNSTLDFYHLLLSGVQSFSKPQVFTCLTIQEAGAFLKNGSIDLPLGHLVVSIYRSWAFVQRDVMEEFKTDDGIPYWYHRRTGQTFWQRPLHDDELISPLLGGTIIDDAHSEEPTLSRLAVEGQVSRRYLQGEFRKSIIAHHETDREAIRRRWNVSYAAEKARDQNIFKGIAKDSSSSYIPVANMDNTDSDINRIVHQRQDNALMNAILSSGSTNKKLDLTNEGTTMMASTANLLELEINTQKNKMVSIPDNTAIFTSNASHQSLGQYPIESNISGDVNPIGKRPGNLHINTHEGYQMNPDPSKGGPLMSVRSLQPHHIDSNQSNHVKAPQPSHHPANDDQKPPLPAISNQFNPAMLNTLTQSIGMLLSQVDSANPQDMIQIGFGMGIAIMQSANNPKLVEHAAVPDSTVHHPMNDGHDNQYRELASTRSMNPKSVMSFGSPRSAVTNASFEDGNNLSRANMILSPAEHSMYSGNMQNASSALTSPLSQNGHDPMAMSSFMPIFPQNQSKEPIGLPNPTVSTSANKYLNHSEELQQRDDVSKLMSSSLTTMEHARKVQVVNNTGNYITQTPDVAPPDANYIDYPRNADERMKDKVPVLLYPELATSVSTGLPRESTTHPSATTHEAVPSSLLDPNDNIKLQKHNLPLPQGFHEAIFASHVAKQEVDYLPQIPNLPQTRTVGRVKPRSAALDWIAISFDPWSAGKPPVNTEFVTSLTANASKFFEGGDLLAVDAVETLRQQTITSSDTFNNNEDIEGRIQQRAEISRAQIMAQDFKKICSLCRHNKYSEVEQLINQPDWTLPIDYQDDQGDTLLHIAAQNGNKRMIKIFMRRGISLDTQNLQGQTALHYLYGYGYADVGDYLVKKGANDAIKNKDGLTCYEGLGARELSLL